VNNARDFTGMQDRPLICVSIDGGGFIRPRPRARSALISGIRAFRGDTRPLRRFAGASDIFLDVHWY
jgi:hypothetical protein